MLCLRAQGTESVSSSHHSHKRPNFMNRPSEGPAASGQRYRAWSTSRQGDTGESTELSKPLRSLGSRNCGEQYRHIRASIPPAARCPHCVLSASEHRCSARVSRQNVRPSVRHWCKTTPLLHIAIARESFQLTLVLACVTGWAIRVAPSLSVHRNRARAPTDGKRAVVALMS